MMRSQSVLWTLRKR